MGTLTLDILLDNEDILFLNELGYSICIVRPVTGFDLGVVWHRIPPKEMGITNHVTWTEEYSVFHQEAIAEAGETLDCNDAIQAQTSLGQAWMFETTFEELSVPVTSDTVLVCDEHQSIHTLGLAQRINGEVKPLGGIPSAHGIDVSMTPKEYVYVFIGRNQESELLRLAAMSHPLKVEYTVAASMTVKFNKELARFSLACPHASN